MANNRFTTSTNPFVSAKSFEKSKSEGNVFGTSSDVMTIQGAVNKSFILTGILLVSAIVIGPMIPFTMPIFYGTLFAAIGIGFVSFMKPTVAPYTAPLYAVVEGVLVGGISYAFADALGPGIIFNALLLTILCLVSMLGAYKFGIIKPTEKFRSVITTATGAIMMIYLLSLALNMFGIEIPYLHQGGPIGIGISLVILVIASLNLILDFDNIEKGAQAGAPKYMEWVCGLGLLMTLVWIYLEILHLLSMFAGSD